MTEKPPKDCLRLARGDKAKQHSHQLDRPTKTNRRAKTMQQNTVPIMGITGYAETYTAEKDGLIYVAEEQQDSFGYGFPDWCCPNAIKVTTNGYGEIRLEVVEHCQHCESDSPELIRVMSEWDAVLLIGDRIGDPLDYDAELTKILATASYVVVADRYLGYKAMPSGPVEPSGGQYLIFGMGSATSEDILPYACEIVAHLNGWLWEVGAIRAEDVEDITELRVTDCDDICGGFVWGNADCYGMSTPTAEELTSRF